jgi:hypothetical protein
VIDTNPIAAFVSVVRFTVGAVLATELLFVADASTGGVKLAPLNRVATPITVADVAAESVTVICPAVGATPCALQSDDRTCPDAALSSAIFVHIKLLPLTDVCVTTVPRVWTAKSTTSVAAGVHVPSENDATSNPDPVTVCTGAIAIV